MLDILITGSEVYDGDGGPPKRLDVGIKDGRIAYLEADTGSNAAKEIIRANGLCLSPGFIDPHASTGLSYLRKGAADNKLHQGVTFELIGNCGTSTAPIGELLTDIMHQQAEKIGFTFDWQTLDEYFSRTKACGLPINLATLIGHSTLRHGYVSQWEHISSVEMQQMREALDVAMHSGALGFSSGLIYPPGCFADTEELISLGKVVAKHGGFYASHIRDERNDVEAAVDEALHIAKGANLPVLISHLKAADKPNWGKVPKLIEKIKFFRAHHDIQAIVDVYPYSAVSTKLRAFLPKDLLADGLASVSEKLASVQWQQRCVQWLEERETSFNDMIVISEDIENTCGRSISDIATSWQKTPAETACELVRRIPELWIVYHCISEADMDAAVLWEDAVICSDSWSYPINAKTNIGNPHPRTYGAFSRFLDRYVFSSGRLSYGDAIRKITAQPADFLGLKQRGRIIPGYWADVVLMDPNTFSDNATYQNPRQFSEGVSHLWINGIQAIKNGEIINDTCGHIIKP